MCVCVKESSRVSIANRHTLGTYQYRATLSSRRIRRSMNIKTTSNAREKTRFKVFYHSSIYEAENVCFSLSTFGNGLLEFDVTRKYSSLSSINTQQVVKKFDLQHTREKTQKFHEMPSLRYEYKWRETRERENERENNKEFKKCKTFCWQYLEYFVQFKYRTC